MTKCGVHFDVIVGAYEDSVPRPLTLLLSGQQYLSSEFEIGLSWKLLYADVLVVRVVKIARFLRSINRHEKDRSINRLTGLAREASPEASRNLHDTLFYDRPTADVQRQHRCTSCTVCR